MTTDRVRAASNYRQVLLTYTEERGRWVTVRVAVKPANVQWHERHTVVHERFQVSESPGCLADVYAALVDYLGQGTLPESHT